MALLGGCQMRITAPANGTSIVAPSQATVSWDTVPQNQISVSYDTLNISSQFQVNGSAAQGVLLCPATGAHTMNASGIEVGGFYNGESLTAPASTFQVIGSPFSYPCYGSPGNPNASPGILNPTTCECCFGSVCDQAMTSNFGPVAALQGLAGCSTQLLETQQTQTQGFTGCVNGSAILICGSNITVNANSAWGMGPAGCPEYVAASFQAAQTGHVSQVVAQLGSLAGVASVNVDIMADSGGVPGTLLARWVSPTLPVFGLVPPAAPPTHIWIPQVGNALVAGTTYWVVMEPATADTNAIWQLSNGAPSTTTNFLVGSSTAGPWQSAATVTSLPLVPAFEVDGH